MLAVIKNDIRRLMEEKVYVIIAVILTICSVSAAILLTNKVESKGNLAIIVEKENFTLPEVPYFNITEVTKTPPKSELVQNRYDAVIYVKEDGTYRIDTIKDQDFKAMVETFLKDPTNFQPNMEEDRRIGANIIGYMMMFLLLQGMLYTRLFAEDKEKHLIERVAMSPIAFTKYLLGHAVFILVLTFLPSYGVIVVAKLLGAEIGFSLLCYSGLIAILSILSTAFALFINSFFCVSDTANMLGQSVILLSSILAGSFYSFSKKETLFNTILHILPQKDFVNFVDALEKGSMNWKIELQLFYVVILSLVFFGFAIFKTRRDYVYRT